MDKVKIHFNKIAKDYDSYKRKNWYYYKNLKNLLSSLIPINKKVLEVGCGTGDLIVLLKPTPGVGYDLSDEMIKIAKNKHKKINFSNTWPEEKFDYIFMSDVIEHLENPKQEFEKIVKLMNNKSLLVNTMANPIWEPILMLGEKIGYKMPEGPHKRLRYKDIKLLMDSIGLKIIKHDYRLLMPIYIPIITDFVNKYLERYLKKYAFIEYFVAKKK